MNRNETKVMEEYCWAITQAVRQSCCNQSGSSVLEFEFQLDAFACIYVLTISVLNPNLRKIQLVPDLPECNYCLCQGVSAYFALY